MPSKLISFIGPGVPVPAMSKEEKQALADQGVLVFGDGVQPIDVKALLLQLAASGEISQITAISFHGEGATVGGQYAMNFGDGSPSGVIDLLRNVKDSSGRAWLGTFLIESPGCAQLKMEWSAAFDNNPLFTSEATAGTMVSYVGALQLARAYLDASLAAPPVIASQSVQSWQINLYKMIRSLYERSLSPWTVQGPYMDDFHVDPPVDAAKYNKREAGLALNKEWERLLMEWNRLLDTKPSGSRPWQLEMRKMEVEMLKSAREPWLALVSPEHREWWTGAGEVLSKLKGGAFDTFRASILKLVHSEKFKISSNSLVAFVAAGGWKGAGVVAEIWGVYHFPFTAPQIQSMLESLLGGSTTMVGRQQAFESFLRFAKDVGFDVTQPNADGKSLLDLAYALNDRALEAIVNTKLQAALSELFGVEPGMDQDAALILANPVQVGKDGKPSLSRSVQLLVKYADGFAQSNPAYEETVVRQLGLVRQALLQQFMAHPGPLTDLVAALNPFLSLSPELRAQIFRSSLDAQWAGASNAEIGLLVLLGGQASEVSNPMQCVSSFIETADWSGMTPFQVKALVDAIKQQPAELFETTASGAGALLRVVAGLDITGAGGQIQLGLLEAILNRTLQVGVSLDTPVGNGQTALLLAVSLRNFDVALLMLARGGDPWARNGQGRNVLDLLLGDAAAGDPAKQFLIDTLMKRAEVLASTPAGKQAFIDIAKTAIQSAAFRANAGALKALLEVATRQQASDQIVQWVNDALGPLLVSSEGSQAKVESLNVLYEYGAKIADPLTPLVVAKDVPLVLFLLSQGAHRGVGVGTPQEAALADSLMGLALERLRNTAVQREVYAALTQLGMVLPHDWRPGGGVTQGRVALAGDVLIGQNSTIGSGVVLGQGVRIGDGAKLQYLVELRDGVSVGEGAVIGHGALVEAGVRIGEGSQIGAKSIMQASVKPGSIVPANVLVSADGVFDLTYDETGAVQLARNEASDAMLVSYGLLKAGAGPQDLPGSRTRDWQDPDTGAAGTLQAVQEAQSEDPQLLLTGEPAKGLWDAVLGKLGLQEGAAVTAAQAQGLLEAGKLEPVLEGQLEQYGWESTAQRGEAVRRDALLLGELLQAGLDEAVQAVLGRNGGQTLTRGELAQELAGQGAIARVEESLTGKAAQGKSEGGAIAAGWQRVEVLSLLDLMAGGEGYGVGHMAGQLQQALGKLTQLGLDGAGMRSRYELEVRRELKRQGVEDAQVSIMGSGDMVSIANWYGGSANQIERIEAGGESDTVLKVLSNNAVAQLVNAMAGMAPPPGATSWSSLPAAQNQQLRGLGVWV